MSNDRSHPPVNQAYWSLLLASFATFLVGIAPDSGAKYRDALDELVQVDRLGLRVDRTYAYLAKDVAASLQEDVPDLIKSALAKAQKSTVSDNVMKNLDYYFVDKGPLTIPTKIAELHKQFQVDTTYVVKVPNTSELRIELTGALAGVQQPFVSDIDISCNWANDRCNVNLALSDSLSEENSEHREFKLNARTLKLSNSSFYRYVMSASSYFTLTNIRLPHTASVLPEIYDSDLDKAIAQLDAKSRSQAGEVSIFGFSVKGKTALAVLPSVLLAIELFLLATLREVARERIFEPHLGCPLFFKSALGVFIAWFTALLFPVAAVALTEIRFFDWQSLVSWYGLICCVALVTSTLMVHTELRSLVGKASVRSVVIQESKASL